MRPASPQETRYAQRLVRLAQRGGRVRRLFDPQRLYGWHLRSLAPGFILDVGCGIGRTLSLVRGHGVGIDNNPACVAEARSRGLIAYSPEAFDAAPNSFDSLVFSHVLEHLPAHEVQALVSRYLPYLADNGKLLVICPQERGQRSDPSHVSFVDEQAIRRLATNSALVVRSLRSFPLPRWCGRWFTHNETVAVLTPAR